MLIFGYNPEDISSDAYGIVCLFESRWEIRDFI